MADCDLRTASNKLSSDWVQMGLRDQMKWWYRACLIARGFSQIPGLDFSENFSPVVNDITFHIALA